MDNRIRDTFDKISAEAALKQKTADFLQGKIQQKNSIKKTVQLRLSAICASFIMLFIIAGLSYNLYFTPSAYVDIDVNPSIELVVNRFGRVIEVSPYNDDGAVILHDVNVQHMRYEDAVDKLIGVMAANGYLKQDGMVSITVQTDGRSRENNMLIGLQTTIDNSLQTHYTNADSDVFAVSEDVRTYAHENHMTPAKYLAVSELQQVYPAATFESCRDHTIREINEMIEEHGGGHHGGEDTQPSPSQPAPQKQPDDGEHGDGHH